MFPIAGYNLYCSHVALGTTPTTVHLYHIIYYVYCLLIIFSLFTGETPIAEPDF